MKTPKFLSKLSAVLTPRTKTKYRTTARAVRPSDLSDYEDQEPTTKLSSAFIVVLILHVVAVGGIYAFNSIKAARDHGAKPTASAGQPAKPASDEAAAKSPGTPTGGLPAPMREVVAAAPVTHAPALKPGQYLVKNGDNLSKIAATFGTTRGELAAANSIKETALLPEGMAMTIPKASPKPLATEEAKPLVVKVVTVPPTKTTPGLHVVKKGETLTSIAKTYGLTAKDLLALNRVSDPTKLQLGQALKVPAKKH